MTPPRGRIPVSGPSITRAEIELVTEAVTTAWHGNHNVYNERFERAFAEWVGTRHAVALPSCTAAIHLALLALGVGPGDEVVVPESTWIATAAPVSYMGATPVFADVDPAGWCLSPAALERSLTDRTRAVIPVDLYGNVADMDAIRAIAGRRGIAVIEDAAEAIGSELGGKKAGSLGDVGVFSFHGSKTLTTGEGGMLVTDRTDLVERVLSLRDHGRSTGGRMFWNLEVGWKYKMSAMQAALGLAQLGRIEELVAQKRLIFDWYRARLEGVPGVTLNHERAGSKSTYWMVTVVLEPGLGLEKEQAMAALSARGIDTRPFFYPLSSLPAYAGHPGAPNAAERSPVSYRLGRYGLNLPSGLQLRREEVECVCEALLAILAR